MTDEDILLEYELEMIARGEKLKACPRCGTETHRTYCPNCVVDGKPIALSGDQFADDVAARLEAGEDIDLNDVFQRQEQSNVTGLIENFEQFL